jgi:ATP-dependent DNA helicase RecG
MKAHIDLNELLRRESEQVEWKENVSDVEDVVATLAAFANDLQNLGGGYLVCGAAETKDAHGFSRVNRVGLDASRMKEVEGKVLSLCQDRVSPAIAPMVDELAADTDERRVLVFTIAATRTPHVFRKHDGSSAHFIRVGRTTRQARNGLLLQLLAQKGALEPWDERPAARATVDHLDPLALRAVLQRMGMTDASKHVDRYLTGEEHLTPFAPTLCAWEPLTKVLRPRHFALLLFGLEPQRFVQSAVSTLTIYAGIDRASRTASRFDFAGTLFDQFRDLWAALQAHVPMVFDSQNLEAPNLHLYPEVALREAVVNAIVHRDYLEREPTRVTVFADRIEVASPGGLAPGVTLAALRGGKAGPKWRNRSLAWFFRELQLAQAEGQGIQLIRAASKAAGCPPPRFEASEVLVTCTLYPNPRAREIEGEVRSAHAPRSKRRG